MAFGVMRWRCPVDDCEWTHEEPAGGKLSSFVVRDGEPLDAAITREAHREHVGRELVIREHMETHDVADYVRTIVQLRHRLGCMGDSEHVERSFGPTDAAL